MTDTPETDANDDAWAHNMQYDTFNSLMDTPLEWDEFARKLERERDEAIRSCHIWQKGHAELVTERDYLLNQLQVNQPERKHIGRWGHNRQEFTSPYINNSKQ
jgi:hypothetical protein